MILFRSLAALALAALLSPAHAQTPAPSPQLHDDRAPEAQAADSVTQGSVTLAGGKTVAYTATAGMLTVGATDKDDAMLALDGEYLPEAAADRAAKPEDRPATARMFYTAYIAKGRDAGTRPIVFFYNGGPGSATMYLRMTSLGPVRVAIPDLQHPVGGP